MIALFIFIGIILILIFMAISIYNKYVILDMENQNAFSNIGVFLQKRLDLIPNLVETVKGYAKHESETLEKVIQARSSMMKIDLSDIENIEKISKMENQLTKTLRSIMALNESYPELKANLNFIELQKSLKEIEKEIEGSRRYYNATASDLNIFVRKFPNVIFSGIFKFRNANMFKEDEESKFAPKVSF